MFALSKMESVNDNLSVRSRVKRGNKAVKSLFVVQIFLQLSYYSTNLLLIAKTTVIPSCFAFKIMNINTYMI